MFEMDMNVLFGSYACSSSLFLLVLIVGSTDTDVNNALI